MSKEDFRGMMGIADSSSSTMILDRVFESISVRPEGISFLEFARYVDILFNGDQAAKAHLSFRMIDSKKRGFLTIQDFTSLILTAIITTHGIRGGRKTDFGSKASAMAECIFAKFNKTKEETVSISEFVSSVEEDPSLLEIFTLLSKGVTESIVQPNEEDAQLKWYHGQAKFIYLCAKGILKDFLEQNGFIRSASPNDQVKFTSDFNRDLRIDKLSSSWYKATNEKYHLDEPNHGRKMNSDFLAQNPFKMARSDFKPESQTAREVRKGLGLNNIGISESDLRQNPQVDQFTVSSILPEETHHFGLIRDAPGGALAPKRAISNPAGEKRGSISIGTKDHKPAKPIQLLHDNTEFLMRELEDKLDPFVVKDRTGLDHKPENGQLPRLLVSPLKYVNGKDSLKSKPANRHQDTEEKVGLLEIQADQDHQHRPFRFPPSPSKDGTHNTSMAKPDILHQLWTEGSPQNANLHQTAMFPRTSEMQGAGDFSFANAPGGVGKDRLMRNTPFDTPLTPQLIGAMLQEQKEKAGKQTDLDAMQVSRATEQAFTGGIALSTLHGGGLVSQTDATELLTLGGKLTADFKREPKGDSVDRSNLVVMIRGRPERRTNTGEPRETSTPPDSGRHSRLQSIDEIGNLENRPNPPLPRIMEEPSQTNLRSEGVRHKGISLTKANQKVEEMFRQLEHDQSSANTPIEANTPKVNEFNRSVGARRKAVGWADEALEVVGFQDHGGLGGELGKSDGSMRFHQLSNAAVDLEQEKGELKGSNRLISEQLNESHTKHAIDRDKLKLPIHRITDSVDSFNKSIPARRSMAAPPTTGNKNAGRLLAATSGQLGQPTVVNDSMFGDSDIGAGFTERLSRLELLRKKLEDIVLFCEDIVKKLNQELLQKQEERNQITKVLQRATVNIPKTAPEDGDGSKESLVFIFHKDWNLVINIMIGINKAIRALWDLEQHSLMPADYKMKDMFELAYHRSLGGDLNSKQTISFICYAPYVFADIRRLYSIDDEAFLNSIGSDTLIGNLIRGEVKAFRELFSTGQSGSFFYYSVDGNYVIKTLRSDEYRFFKSILVDYHQHLRENPKTLMPKFFGLYEILSVPKNGCCSRSCCGKGIFSWASNRIFLVVMENIFGTEMKIDRRFDLKGSTYNRTVGPQKLQGKNKSMIALKDMDFLASDSQIKLPAAKIEAFMQIIEKDCKFFERMNIIDYSLLLGVHNGKMVSEQMLKKDWPYFLQEVSSNKDEVYFFGIIDILTSFSQVKKKLEFCFKRTFLGPGVSCIPAGQYSTRFQDFMRNSVFQATEPVSNLDPNPSPSLAKASQLQNKESNPASLEFASVQPQRSASGLSGKPQPSPPVKTPKPPSQSHL